MSRYQLAEARAAGADAVLLIAECLPGDELADLHAAALGYGLPRAGRNCTTPANLPRVADLAAAAPDRIAIGVNNRDLRTFAVDLNHSLRLAKQAPCGGRVRLRERHSHPGGTSTGWRRRGSRRCWWAKR